MPARRICGRLLNSGLTPAKRAFLATTLLFGGLAAFTSAARAQGGVPLWTNHYGVAGAYATAAGIAVDRAGNVFVTGVSGDNGFNEGYATVAYSGEGVPLWTNRYATPEVGNDDANAIAVDRLGNIFVTGNSAPYYSYVGYPGYTTLAYSGAGIPLWTNHLQQLGGHGAKAIAVDSSGNVVVTGDLLDRSGLVGYGTVAYSGAGVPLWTNVYHLAGDYAEAYALAVDKSGNVFVTGSSANGYGTVAYSRSGIPLWTNIYHGPNGAEWANAIATDGTGNVFVTGGSYNSLNGYYATVAYSGSGVPLWTNIYRGNNGASAIAVDSSGKVFVTGAAIGIKGYSASATVAYSRAGIPLWTNVYGAGNNYATAIAVDSSGNVFVTAGVWDASGHRGNETVAYSGAGVLLWSNRYLEAQGFDSAIAVDSSGGVFVAGTAAGEHYSHYFTIKYSSSARPNSPPIVSCSQAARVECGTPVELTAHVSLPDGDALTVLWTINGQVVQTNSVPTSNPAVGTNVSLIAELPVGTNLVEVLVSDQATNTATCSTTVAVIDAIPPVIVSATANPSVLWPPNHQMVPVNVSAQANDNCGPAVWKIADVRSNEPVNSRIAGSGGADWVIAGDHTVNLRAERSGTGAGRIYSIIVQAKDNAGNLSDTRVVTVVVPKSQGK